VAGNKTVLLTVHGVGFQTEPDVNNKGVGGYADNLQTSLLETDSLKDLLGGDPEDEFHRGADYGAIYVQSSWFTDTKALSGPRSYNAGLGRLGYCGQPATEVPKLFQSGRPIAHVALVYSNLENTGAHLGASLEVIADAFGSHRRYGSLASILGRTGKDFGSALIDHLRSHGVAKPPAGLTVRPMAGQSSHVIPRFDQDVAAYVCRNDLRTDLRDFVADVMERLACRSDVDNIVVNAHSQGTVLTFDVLRSLSIAAQQKLRMFITSGSPLRKYAAFFYWGTEVGTLHTVDWINFWDGLDPFADPLESKLPDDTVRPGAQTLFYWSDPATGDDNPVVPRDFKVDNVHDGGGGFLPAHDYWGNRNVIASIAGALHAIASDTAV